MTRCALPVYLLVLLAWSAPALAFDNDRYVTMDGNDTGNCATLLNACRSPSYALSVSAPGDVIYIHEGEYAQHLVIDRNITLRGSGPGMTVLLGPISSSGATALERVVTVDGSYQVRIEAMSIKNGAAHPANGLFDGGGIYSPASALTLKHVRVEANRSPRHGGGIYHGVGKLTLINTVVSANMSSHASETTRGGGLYLASGQVVIVNSTIVRNMADTGGGLMINTADAQLFNSIVWDNLSLNGLAHEIHQAGSASGLAIRHSIFRDRPGESDVVGSNITVDAASLNEDPMWLSSHYWLERDYRLRPMSPAINAGNNGLYTRAGGNLTSDLDHGGSWRVWNHAGGGLIDIGAYEFQGEPAQLAAPALIAPAHGTVNLPLPIRLRWQGVAQADSYQFQVAEASVDVATAFNDPVIDDIVTSTQVNVSGLDALQDYDWRVRPVMNGFVGDWSQSRVFTTRGLLQPGPGNVLHVTDAFYPAQGDNSGSDWANAVDSLAVALKWAAHTEDEGLWNADNPLQIWVSSGVQRPGFRPDDLLELPGPHFSINRQGSFVMVPNVQIYGGFNRMDLDADMSTRDPAAYPSILDGASGYYNLVIAAGAVGSARLDGFIVRGGNARGELISQVRGEAVHRSSGGAIHLINSSPTLSQLDIIDNQARYFGGGIYAEQSQSRLDRIRLTHAGSEFQGGGLYSADSDLVISNSVLADNQALVSGGGIYQLGGQLHLLNSTIANNHALRGGGLYNVWGHLTLDNAIAWGNQADYGRQYSAEGGTGTWRYSLFANAQHDMEALDGLDIEQALHQDPQFTDPDTGNYLPAPGSPVRDSGSNALYAAGAGPDQPWDLAGQARIVNGHIDRGALEIQSGTGDDVIFQDGFE